MKQELQWGPWFPQDTSLLPKMATAANPGQECHQGTLQLLPAADPTREAEGLGTPLPRVESKKEAGSTLFFFFLMKARILLPSQNLMVGLGSLRPRNQTFGPGASGSTLQGIPEYSRDQEVQERLQTGKS